MRPGHIVTWFCIWQLLWTLSTSDVCPYQECECSTTAIFCEGKHLQAIPQLVNKNQTIYTALLLDDIAVNINIIQLIADCLARLRSVVCHCFLSGRLTYPDNHIRTIPEGSLPPNLTQLSLLDNPLTFIDDSAFRDSTASLTVFIFSKAMFTRIPNALLLLQNLQELHVKDVGPLDWDEGVMQHIGSTLNILYLENVTLTSPPTWLQYLSRATELNIVSSNLTSLPDTALDNMADTLLSISFENNLFTEVPKALSKLNSLKYLDLSNNKISGTKWLPISNHVKTVTLNGNRIFNSSELSYSLRSYGQSLVDFNIEDNDLVSFPDLSFLENMRSLSLTHNRISEYSSGALPSNLFALDLENNLLRSIPVGVPGLESVETLTLKSNMITQIQGSDFPPRASVVVLAFNLITSLTDDSFPEHSIIESLYLNNNPISAISSGAFKGLGMLEQLSLQGTKLTRLPLALTSLADLTSLDVSDIAGLVCTCLEKGLAAWMLSPKVDNVMGNCGNIRVYDFFSILSPGCPSSWSRSECDQPCLWLCQRTLELCK